ncbi:hypothetical protein [Paractinoplanes hotanensis]|uniref:Uncharacterized protein n=1 Tax=Paractinoplanes hotanensis TaxID=2906497 RepID=A0ABT0Y2Z7_9ACTN|nr:hypothetical protein [Actinoplanes hotanensis]MCM4080409.1 hypothetical protein [Actinoplanes hotanensis]
MIKLKIMPDEGDAYELAATSRDIAKWERTNKGASLAKLQADMHATDLYKIAYNAAVRTGQFDGTAKDFEESCDLDELDEDEVDPTQSAA